MSAAAEETTAQANLVSAAAEEVSANTKTVSGSVENLVQSIYEIARSAQDAAGVARQSVEMARATSSTMDRLGVSSAEAFRNYADTSVDIAAPATPNAWPVPQPKINTGASSMLRMTVEVDTIMPGLK